MLTVSFMQYGQIIDHDTDRTPISKLETSTPGTYVVLVFFTVR